MIAAISLEQTGGSRKKRGTCMAEDMKDKDLYTADDEEFATVTLTLDDDSELECDVLAIYPAGGKKYIALTPSDQIDDEQADVYLYRFEELKDGEIHLENIIEDDEYEVAADAFDELLDEREFDSLFGE